MLAGAVSRAAASRSGSPARIGSPAAKLSKMCRWRFLRENLPPGVAAIFLRDRRISQKMEKLEKPFAMASRLRSWKVSASSAGSARQGSKTGYTWATYPEFGFDMVCPCWKCSPARVRDSAEARILEPRSILECSAGGIRRVGQSVRPRQLPLKRSASGSGWDMIGRSRDWNLRHEDRDHAPSAMQAGGFVGVGGGRSFRDCGE